MTSIRTGCGWSSGTMFPAGMASCINSSSVLVGRFSKLSKSKPESTSYLEAAAGSEVSSGADVVRDHIFWDEEVSVARKTLFQSLCSQQLERA